MTLKTFVFEHEALPSGQYLVSLDVDDLDVDMVTLAWRPYPGAAWRQAAGTVAEATGTPAASAVTDTRPPVHLGNLSGSEGNAWVVMGRATKVYADAGATAPELLAFRTEMMAGDYTGLLGAIDARLSATVTDSDGSRISLAEWLEYARRT